MLLSEIEFSLIRNIYHNIFTHAPGFAALGARFPDVVDQGDGVVFYLDVYLFRFAEHDGRNIKQIGS